MSSPSKILQIRVPCSSSNIGPGFDVLGVTLSLYLTLTVKILPKHSNLPNFNEHIVLAYSGEGSSHVPLSINQNLITKTALFVLASHNINGFPSPMIININNEIPFGRGLGSSGAAVVAGVILGDIAGDLKLTKDRLLDHCLMIERHPDNVTAALMGGFVASYLRELDSKDIEAPAIPHSETLEDGITANEQAVKQKELTVPNGIGHYIRLKWAKEIKAITIIPQFEVATATARSVLPNTYERQDVVFNLQRLAVLTTALSQSPPDADLIFQAMQDKIHQPYRMELIPGLSEILSSVNPKTVPGFLGICLSGAGPTILALAVNNFDLIADRITEVLKRKKDTQVIVKTLDIVDEGAQVIELTESS
ncbi:homoserine kinase [Rhizophagus irregularis]|uniref:Homoserine kinase n=2 Tax=Rhizophagus irregularis TaxID=588596 RepID=A0A2I1G7A8_9GLOM|nr:GHMP kinase [Rhizophagus irregularis DAOM 181602=DAOM 197198]PKC13757.1 homoserine kinase [Rhizophagus irregularis]PKC68755.1 homoserine kinase [Rhizophagus irregularis]PKK79797.1 homoserine kinase [Rhizophagus irregularis]PKY42514.1 homoserine kinase [Rhizophagus irregularis]POG82705.1 GHMP kinase [Rhizophagus irregularis DAOM 181602=DAOM 197198]|eukprot:XP_025189571.1 GHMP kinase [Rhizophagus irregularis DAOM 181602=DAOM 197198]